jgi:hypothetical protein
MDGENEDRGDDFTPTGPDADPNKIVVDDPKPKAIADGTVGTKKVEGEGEGDDDAKAAADKEAADKAAADAAAAAAGDKTKVKDTRIPAARHKEILDKERERREAVETELAKYKQGEKIAEVGADITAAETELLELETAYAKQVADGEVKDAAATMAKIRRTERSINEKNAQVREAAAEARAVERVRYDTTVERLEAQYPQLNPDDEAFDKTKTAEVLELKEAYQLKGFTPSAALQKAVKLIMPPITKAQEAATNVTPNVDAAAVEKARKAAAVDKITDALAKTPASAAKVGKDSDAAGGGAVTAADVLKMSYADFSKLDEATLAKMRGDVI